METTPKVAIIVPVYNAEKYIRQSIGSLLSQTYRNHRVILVDDGSTDDTMKVIESFDDKRLEVHSMGRNGGPAKARNRALTLVKEKYICFFDADDVASPEMLSVLLEYLSKNPSMQAVTSWHAPMNAVGEVLGEPRGFDGEPERIPSVMLFENCLGTSSMLIEREAIAGKGFDEALSVASDYELWCRLMPSCRFGVVPMPLVGYRAHAGNITHRMRSNADPCLDVIMRRQLLRLGVNPRQEELELHRVMTRLTYGTSMEFVQAAGRWLVRLNDSNKALKIYNEPSFRRELADRWLNVCYSACGNGWRIWSAFYGLALARDVTWKARSRYSFVRLAVRGEVKMRWMSGKALMKRVMSVGAR